MTALDSLTAKNAGFSNSFMELLKNEETLNRLPENTQINIRRKLNPTQNTAKEMLTHEEKIQLLKAVQPTLQNNEVFDLNVKKAIDEKIKNAEEEKTKSAERAQILEEISKTATKLAALDQKDGCSDCVVFRKIFTTLLADVDTARELRNAAITLPDQNAGKELLATALLNAQEYLFNSVHTWQNMVQKETAEAELGTRVLYHEELLTQIEEAITAVKQRASEVHDVTIKGSLELLVKSLTELRTAVRADVAKFNKIFEKFNNRILSSTENLDALWNEITSTYELSPKRAKSLVLERIIAKHKSAILRDTHAVFDGLYTELITRGMSAKHAEAIVVDAISALLFGKPEEIKKYQEIFKVDQDVIEQIQTGATFFQFTINGQNFKLERGLLDNHLLRRHAFGVLIDSDKERNQVTLFKEITIPSLNSIPSSSATTAEAQLRAYRAEFAKIPQKEVHSLELGVLKKVIKTLEKPDIKRQRQNEFGSLSDEYEKRIGRDTVRVRVEKGIIVNITPL